MGEIEMLCQPEVREKVHILRQLHEIPAHVRDDLVGGQGGDVTSDQTQTLMRAVFAALLEEHLKADANAQDGLARRDRPLDRLGGRAQGLHGVAEGRHTGQDQARGLRDGPGIPAQLHRTADMAERVADALDVSHVVIDDDNHPDSVVFLYRQRQIRICNTLCKQK